MKKIKEIILRGYTKANISKENYSYSNNLESRDICSSEECSIKFNITNNLGSPVSQTGGYLFNLTNRGIANYSICRFTTVNSGISSSGNVSIVETNCDNRIYCELEMINKNKREIIFAMHLSIGEDIVKLDYINIKEPIKVNPVFKIQC